MALSLWYYFQYNVHTAHGFLIFQRLHNGHEFIKSTFKLLAQFDVHLWLCQKHDCPSIFRRKKIIPKSCRNINERKIHKLRTPKRLPLARQNVWKNFKRVWSVRFCRTPTPCRACVICEWALNCESWCTGCNAFPCHGNRLFSLHRIILNNSSGNFVAWPWRVFLCCSFTDSFDCLWFDAATKI